MLEWVKPDDRGLVVAGAGVFIGNDFAAGSGVLAFAGSGSTGRVGETGLN